MSTNINNKNIVVYFKFSDNDIKKCFAIAGETVLTVARNNDINLEGACDGSLACSTCHVILDDEFFDKFPIATDEEENMLDLAYDVQINSRLGCQLIITEEHNNIVFNVPKGSRNIALDDMQ